MKSLIPSPTASRRGGTVLNVIICLVLIGIFAISLLPTVSAPIRTAKVAAAAGGMAKISQAYIAMISGDKPRPINAATIHECAVALAQYGDLNDPEVWLFKSDPRVEDKIVSNAKFPSVVADKPSSAGEKWTVNEEFKAWPISLAVANKTPSKAKETAPILWTRGLKSDGTWDKENSVFGAKHGIILFRNGQVRIFKGNELAENGGALINYKTGQSTKNILEAIHPEANVLESK